MKKQLFLILSMAFAIYSSGQQTIAEAPAVKTDYLKKSKTQKTVAWILAGSGVGLMVAGFATVSEKDAANYVFQVDNSGFNTSVTLFVIGGITTLSSIPLFIASGRNKRKGLAVSASVKMENADVIQRYSMVHTSYPAFSVKINLR